METNGSPRFDGPEYRRIKKAKAAHLARRREAAAAARTPLGILTRAWGVFGFVLYYLFLLALDLAPLFVLDFPWWASLLAILGVFCIPYAGPLFELVLWVWAFLDVRLMPPGLLPALFYIGAALYVLCKLLPGIVSVFTDW